MNPDGRQVLLIGGLILIWVVMQYLLGMKFGIRDGGDTPRYTSAATTILHGNWPTGKALSYLGYDLFVALIYLLGGSRGAIVLAQVLLSGIACYFLFRLTQTVYDIRTARVALLLYLIFPDIHLWNFLILTESLYTSMIIISCYALVTADNARQWLIAILLAAFTCTVRPHGIGFILAIVVFIACRLRHGRHYGMLITALLLAAIVAPFAWDIVGAMAGRESVLDLYHSGTVIWGYEGLTVPPPSGLVTHTGHTNHTLIQLATFIWQQPGYWLDLASWKAGLMLSHLRPYFALWHNTVSILFLLPTYVLFAWGLARTSMRTPCTKTLAAGIIAMQVVVVALTFADWDGRHLVPVLSMVIMVAAGGLIAVYDRVNNKRRRVTA